MLEHKFREMVRRLSKDGYEISTSIDGIKAHTWHMATGISGECSELLECACTFESTGLFDMENATEELGDIYFYLTGLVNVHVDLKIKHNPFNEFSGSEGILSVFSKIAIAGGGILDAVKKHCIYEKDMDYKVMQANIDMLILAMYKAYYIMGISHKEVVDANIHKLIGGDNARYATGTYSNEQAQDRADKMVEQG